MKFNTSIPIYIQIMDSIKKDIVTGILPRGGRLNSVRTLADNYEVNLNTMQRACSELERQGVIYTRRGIGSFVTEEEKVIETLKAEMSTVLTDSFICGMKDLGYKKNEILEIIKKELEK